MQTSNGLLKAELDQIIMDRDELREKVSEAETKSAADAMAKVKVILQKVRLIDQLTFLHCLAWAHSARGVILHSRLRACSVSLHAYVV